MPRIFEDIPLEWKGEKFIIPSNRIMGALARIEELVTLDELHAMTQGKGLKFIAVSRAYASTLRFAGAMVTDEEVYASMFEKDDDKKKGAMITAVFGLLNMMVPEEARKVAEKEAAAKGEPEGNVNRQARRAAASLSKKHTKQPHAGA